MLLAVDIGNSSIKFGVFDGDHLSERFLIPTSRTYSADEIAAHLDNRLSPKIEAAIVCSVVPEIETAVDEFISNGFQINARFVRSIDDFGLKKTFPVESTGTDRLVNSFAAAKKYGVPCIVVSFGTATTVDVVNGDHEYLGGLIAPGMETAAKALHLNTSHLPEVEIRKPEHVIGNSTSSSIQAGLFYSQVGLLESVIRRIQKNYDRAGNVVATGGFASLIAENIEHIDVVDENLLLDGLRLIHAGI